MNPFDRATQMIDDDYNGICDNRYYDHVPNIDIDDDQYDDDKQNNC